MEKDRQNNDVDRVYINNESGKTLLIKVCDESGIAYYTVPPQQEVTLVGKDLKVERIETGE